MTKRRDVDAQAAWFEAKERRSVRDFVGQGVSDAAGAEGLAVERGRFERLSAANSPWSGCTFFDCTFRGSFFYRARFDGCHFFRCRFDDCSLAEARFQACQFEQCAMTDCDLTAACVEVADPAAVRLVRSWLEGARFSGHPFFRRFFPKYVCDEIAPPGKQATVYYARRTLDERRVAIKVFDKVFPGSDTELRLRLARDEIANLKRMDNPFLPRLLSSRLSGRAPYLVEERMAGLALSAWIEVGQRFSGPLRRALFVQSLTGLDSLHTSRDGVCLLHRDIAPKNVMVDVEGKRLDWKFIDLGLSKIIAGASAQASMIAGTPLTMAPEVMLGRGDSTRSELFSLGVTLAWAVTGRHPYGEKLSRDERLAAIDRGPNLPRVEQPYLDILRGCLRYHEQDRLAPRDALARLAA